jgi:hypothetical protein
MQSAEMPTKWFRRKNTIIVKSATEPEAIFSNLQTGQKHHPLCLENPQPIVGFVTKYN